MHYRINIVKKYSTGTTRKLVEVRVYADGCASRVRQLIRMKSTYSVLITKVTSL